MAAIALKPIVTELRWSDFLDQCTLFNELPTAVAIVDRERKPLYINRNFSSFNYAPLYTTAQGKGTTLLNRETVAEEIERCFGTQRGFDLVEELNLDNNIHYPLTIHLQPVIEQINSSIRGVMLTITEGSVDQLRRRVVRQERHHQDLSERIRELSAQSRAKDLLVKSLFTDTPFSLIIFDQQRRVVRMNKSCEELLGRKSALVTGVTCDRILSCYNDNGACIGCDHQDNTVTRDCALYTAEGTELSVLKSVVPHRQDHESFLLEAFVDITDRKRLEKLERDKERDILEATASSKSRFYASLSHELRTPLNAIIGYTEIVLETPGLTSEIAGDVRNIHLSSKHMLQLVNDLLEISKLDSEKTEIILDPVDWVELCEDVIKATLPLTTKNGNQTRFVHQELYSRFQTDPLRLRQILINFLSNAAKFTHDGTISLYVQQKAASNGNIIEFTVKDNGIGMSKDQLDKIFHEYEQADRNINRIYGGTGLGLPICNRLATLMNGNIRAHSEQGIGSTFTLELPLIPPEQRDASVRKIG